MKSLFCILPLVVLSCLAQVLITGPIKITGPIQIVGISSSSLSSGVWGFDENTTNSTAANCAAGTPSNPMPGCSQWTSVTSKIIRSLNFNNGAGTRWSQLDTTPIPAQGAACNIAANHNWADLDKWVTTTNAAGAKGYFEIFGVPDCATCGCRPAIGGCGGQPSFACTVPTNNNQNCGGYTTYSGTGNCNAANATWTKGGGATFGNDPPYDLNLDGTGTDATFIADITAIENEIIAQVGTGVVIYWANQNEPQDKHSGNFSYKQSLRQLADMKVTLQALDPAIKIVTPQQSDGQTYWIKPFLGIQLPAGITQLNGTSLNACNVAGCMASDIIDYVGGHSYYPGNPQSTNPDIILTVLSNYRSVMTGANASKLLMDSENGWAIAQSLLGTCSTSLAFCSNTRSAWVSRNLILSVLGQSGLKPFDIVVDYDFGKGTTGNGPEGYTGPLQLWDDWDTAAFTPCPGTAGALCVSLTYPNLTAEGIAYNQVQSWLIGSTSSLSCTAGATITTCTYIGSDTKQKLIAWNNTTGSGSCFNTGGVTCTPNTYTPPVPSGGAYTKYFRIWDGATSQSCGGTCTSAPINDLPMEFSQ